MYNKRFCKEPEKIENYEKAKADNFICWQCHHRLETHTSDGERRPIDITRDELKALDMYYDRPADELVFMTTKEHRQLHMKGKQFSEEHKNKISEAHKGKQAGENNPMYGKKRSEETKKKLSEANKGKHLSEERKNKIGAARKGKHWFNNGKINKCCYECPDGFVTGRLR